MEIRWAGLLMKFCLSSRLICFILDGFFLEYTIGEQARIFLQDKFKLLQELASRKEKLSSSEKGELTMIYRLVPNIGDALIRHCFCLLLEKLK